MTEKESLMDDDRLVLTEVKTLVGTIREDIHEMRDEIRRSTENKVTRDEWLQHNKSVDGKIVKLGSEISEIKQEIAAKKSPPAVWVAALTALVALIWAIFGPSVSQDVEPEVIYVTPHPS